MAYATLLNAANCSNISELPQMSIRKPQYTPATALKKAYKVLRRFFKQHKASNTGSSQPTSIKHVQLQEEGLHIGHNAANLTAATLAATPTTHCTDAALPTAEEYDNFANELLESAAAKSGLNVIHNTLT